ncbi:MAG: LytTR family transcriptional regulator DNA-binding domain-containing protein [Phaeodactylibacter xiamenensis]|uniref:HTH LytTR-type domain-containing protein n=1 Tax=Phaeodactylibacter xiamenensis TaxID=1524460 RepID=A0A098SAE2_9BACT|nr:LytTR family DNA-binding domain-containing protein [Phaeodactylibacter xiamenensis]KGE89499.1 hypothetical protein IX84_02275 [Phaeodactylibacter xiamenensis]MCR9054567.1 LytTR family transcriptional regulator [bacterium]
MGTVLGAYLEQAYSATTEPEQRLELLAQMTDIAFTKDLQLTMALKNFEALLPAEWFQRTHRSYLVNLRHIEEMVESELIIGDKRLPLGSNWREALMKRLLN